MKQLILMSLFTYCVNTLYSQATFEGNNQLPGQTRYLGHSNNFSLSTRTNNIRRIRLNHDVTYGVGGYGPTGKNGYMLLGFSQGFSAAIFNPLNTNQGAYSLLHLNGPNGTFVQNGGYRPWMQTGVTFTDNDDLSYMGIRSVSPDITETTIAWSDNAGVGSVGPDQMVFRFTSGNVGISGAVASTVSNNLLAVNDLDGLHVVRYTGGGLMGLGNTFGTGNAIYVQPQSLAHLSLSDNRSVWTQYTNRITSAVGSGTGETAGDGLRIGIYSNTDINRNGIAMMYNQEDRPILFSTNAATNSANAINTFERMRVTSVGSPTALSGGGYGIHNPAGLATNLTRVSISYDPANPVTRPKSLLHLGYNTGGALGVTNDGWRNWMDIGTFTGNGTDNMYVGLKNEGVDQFDAVINWGDNQTDATPAGPDHLRFIFTSTTTALPPGTGSPVAVSNNGLEIARMVPIYDTTITDAWVANMNGNGQSTTYGRIGIGDFTAQGVNEEPTHKLDVVGNGRFRFLPDSLYYATPDVTRYVMVDSMGVLRWTDTLIQPSGGFVPCSDSSDLANLLEDSKANLNDFNLYFEDGPDSLTQLDGNQIGLGYDCGEVFPGKLSIDNKSEHNGVYVLSDGVTDVGNWPNVQMAGVSSIVTNSTVISSPTGAFVPAYYGLAENNSPNNLGMLLIARDGNVNIGGIIQAGDATLPSTQSIGLRVSAINSSLINTGVSGSAGGSANFNVGVSGLATGGTTNYGVYGSAPIATGYAGYFSGNVYCTGAYLPSDINLKHSIDSLSLDSASYYINALNPSSFIYQTSSFPNLNLSEGYQYGLIAQEVEQVLPSIVTNVVSPAIYDSLGNEVTPSMTFKTLNYEQFIPILIADAQNKNHAIDSLNDVVVAQDSLINDLNTRLTNLENCLGNILPLLCQINNTMIQQNDGAAQQQLKSMLNVELRDEKTIVLEQNIPNPFAEQTIINFSIPETVQRAQILFYNDKGQLIQTVEVSERGLGQLTVFASDLSTGIYSYTLVADGVIVSTKRMVKTN